MPLLTLRSALKHDELLLEGAHGEKLVLLGGRRDGGCDCVNGRQQLIAHE